MYEVMKLGGAGRGICCYCGNLKELREAVYYYPTLAVNEYRTKIDFQPLTNVVPVCHNCTPHPPIYTEISLGDLKFKELISELAILDAVKKKFYFLNDHKLERLTFTNPFDVDEECADLDELPINSLVHLNKDKTILYAHRILTYGETYTDFTKKKLLLVSISKNMHNTINYAMSIQDVYSRFDAAYDFALYMCKRIEDKIIKDQQPIESK